MIKKLLAAALLLSSMCVAQAENSEPVKVPKSHITLKTQWNGTTAAYLGDSMTDPECTASTYYYWGYLQQLMGIKPSVYGKNGWAWSGNGILIQAQRLVESGEKVDAIFILAGTNDYNVAEKPGTFYTYRDSVVNKNSKQKHLKHRELVMDGSMAGRINATMALLKEKFPKAQIVLLTPIHRGFADFGTGNVQPADDFANELGYFIDDYVKVIREAGQVWSCPVIDLYGDSGLLPALDSHKIYVHNAVNDRLHPDAYGQYRIARTIQFHLMNIAPTF